MRALLGLLAHQHGLPLFRRKPRLKDRALIGLCRGDAELGRLAIKSVSRNGIARDADAVELAPGQGLDRARLSGGRMFLDRVNIVGRRLLQPNVADRLLDGWCRRWWRRQWWGRLSRHFACRIGRGKAAVGAVEIIVLGVRQAWHPQGPGNGNDNRSKSGARHDFTRYRHDTVGLLARFLTLAALCTIAACGEYDSLKGLDSTGQIDWSAKIDEYSQPGPLGTFFNRRPPVTRIRTSGPYPGPLSEPIPPLIAPDIADSVIAPPLLPSLGAEARMSLASASMVAASASTGAGVAWQATDMSGTVTPAHDVYLSHHGLVCRDLQQQVRKSEQSQIAQITLCHQDIGDSHVFWLPASPD